MDKIIVVSNHAKNGFTETEYHFKMNQETEEVRALKNTTPSASERVTYGVKKLSSEFSSSEAPPLRPTTRREK